MSEGIIYAWGGEPEFNLLKESTKKTDKLVDMLRIINHSPKEIKIPTKNLEELEKSIEIGRNLKEYLKGIEEYIASGNRLDFLLLRWNFEVSHSELCQQYNILEKEQKGV